MPGTRLVITYPFPLGRATGGARMTREIALAVARAGAEVVLLPVSSDGGGRFPRRPPEEAALGYEFDAELRDAGVEVRRVPQHRLHWMFDGRGVARAVDRALQERPADMVLSYYHDGGYVPAVAARHGVPFGYISTWQSYEKALAAPLRGIPEPFARGLKQRRVVAPHRQASVLFATSEFTRDELIRFVGVDPERIVICRLGVAPRFFDVPRSAPEQVTRLLFFGRIIPSKGVGDAIEALGQLAAQGVNGWQLRLVGQGDPAWVREAAARCGIADRIELAPAAADDALCAELERAHVAVLPSHFEAFGLAFAEAQAAGLPVVAYRAGSVGEVVEDGVSGWLAPLRDVKALAAHLGHALADPAAVGRAGAAARERVARLFTWERTGQTILDGVGRVCAAEPRP